MDFILNGGSKIQSEIDAAIKNGKREIFIEGNYEIEKAVVIPSHFTVILGNCHLRLQDDSFTNIFTNTATVGEDRTSKARDCDIHIIGRGHAVLDGGKFNGLTERNCRERGMSMTVNNLILLSNLEDFSITGVHLCNQRHWAVNLVHCAFGVVRDIDVLADDEILYVDGERDYEIDYRGLCRNHLPMLRNADGIDLRHGCHDILVENITGFTEDDTVALTALPGGKLSVTDLPTDLYNITVRNVRSSSWCANIRLLNQGGVKLYNILIDGVTDTSKDSTHMNRGLFGIRIGDKRLYSTRHSTPDETYNIVVRNVFSRAETIVDMAGSITNCTVENIYGFDGYTKKIENAAELFGKCKIEE